MIVNFFFLTTLLSAGAAMADQPVTPLVKSFAPQPYAATKLPKPTKEFSSELLADRIKGQDVIRITSLAKKSKQPKLVSVDFAKGAGLAPIAWTVRLPDGREFNLSGAAPAAEIEAAYEADLKNQFRDNLFFQNGVVASLYPFANRLIGKDGGNHLLTTTVEGQSVTMPLNNTAKTSGAIPHHLHGLIYGDLARAPAGKQLLDVTAKHAQVAGEFNIGPDMWTGHTQVITTAALTDSGYSYMMHVKNVGTTPVPVGAGAHPYFSSPDVDHDAIRIHVPARSLVEINSLSDVLPTGKIISIEKSDPALDFRDPNGTLLHAAEIKGNTTASRLDNLWVDLDKDAAGFAFAEVFFPLAHFKVRLTALTKNVIGIQGYAPKFVAGQRPFVALELVTNLPDPREELWGKTPTGMKLLQPGETFDYGYKVEVMPL